jgi:hypothetical protein
VASERGKETEDEDTGKQADGRQQIEKSSFAALIRFAGKPGKDGSTSSP